MMTPDKLRLERKARGLTQPLMAEKLGVGYRTYQEWEDDRPIGARQQSNLDLRWNEMMRNEERAGINTL